MTVTMTVTAIMMTVTADVAAAGGGVDMELSGSWSLPALHCALPALSTPLQVYTA